MKIIKTIFVIIAVSGCAGIPGKNIKLENYPDIKISNEIDIKYQAEKYFLKKPDQNFNKLIVDKIKAKKIQEFRSEYKIPKCIVKISSNNDYGQSTFCKAYGIFSGLTLFIIPAYCSWNYQAHATLISTHDNRILKEYDLKDKVHEVWSLLWAISWLAVNPTKYSNSDYPDQAKDKMEEKLSEALVRSVLNDASKFDECKKF